MKYISESILCFTIYNSARSTYCLCVDQSSTSTFCLGTKKSRFETAVAETSQNVTGELIDLFNVKSSVSSHEVFMNNLIFFRLIKV